MPKRLSMLVEYQKCRNWRHAWDDFIAPRSAHSTIYESPYQETLRCLRCGTERYRGIGYTGDVETNVYDYPEGYQVTADERPELAAIRLSTIQVIRAEVSQAKKTRASRAGYRAPARKATKRKGGRRTHLVAV